MKEPETGKKENTGKSGYSITTWRLHLWCRHPEWLRTTQEFYNRIAEFYYNLLLDHTDLWEMGSQQTLRELEIMSIPGRGGRIPSDPLPWQKVPLYFRRAAANEGIASAKSYISRFAQDEKSGRAEKLNAAVTYYKGMYQDFSAKEITLRVWTGDTWTWLHCRLSGRDFPENVRLMSPSVVFEYKYDMLHVPVRQNNENTATVRQRMQAGSIIKQDQIPANVYGYYVALAPDGKHQKHLNMKGYLYDIHHNQKSHKEETLINQVFETIFMADHGSAKRYIEQEGKYSVELLEPDLNDTESINWLNEYQKGALALGELFVLFFQIYLTLQFGRIMKTLKMQ